MAYEFELFCEDCRSAYNQNTGEADLEVIRQNLEKLIKENPDFIEKNCGATAEYGVNELYTDAQNGFIVYAHNIKTGRTSPPHDHGASWAVYGQAKKYTDMTEYQRLDDKSKPGHAEIQETKKLLLKWDFHIWLKRRSSTIKNLILRMTTKMVQTTLKVHYHLG